MRLRGKGTLDVGSDGDLVLLDPQTLKVRATWVMGECAWRDDKVPIKIVETSKEGAAAAAANSSNGR
jgi:hypothetical protein